MSEEAGLRAMTVWFGALLTLAAWLLAIALVVAGQGQGGATYGCAPGTATYPTAECAMLWE